MKSVLIFLCLFVCVLARSVDDNQSRNENNYLRRNIKGWPSWGHDNLNWNAAINEKKIKSNTVSSLVSLWNFTAGGMSARPTSEGMLVYETDWGGMLWALSIDDGHVVWQFNVSDFIIQHMASIDLNGFLNLASRSSPAISHTENKLFIATLSGAFVICLKPTTGDVLWYTQVETHPFAQITASLTVDDGYVYGGVSSAEESAAAFIPGYACCTFRGSVFALSEDDGTLLWKTYMIPNVTGASGNAVWGSQMSVDYIHDEIKVATGNAYTMPPEIVQCLEDSFNATSQNQSFLPSCRLPGDLSEAVVSLDRRTGYVKSVSYANGLELWNGLCGIIVNGIVYVPRNYELCPEHFLGYDYDFGQAPIIVYGNENTPHGYDVQLTCQKSGICFAHSTQTGLSGPNISPFWTTRIGPGGNGMFSSCTDGIYLYSVSTNSKQINHTLLNGNISSRANWAAVNIKTGELVWQTEVPVDVAYPLMGVTLANDVLFSGTLQFGGDNGGYLYALNANNGQILLQMKLHGQACGAPSIVDGIVLVPCGYFTAGGTISSVGKLYAFGIVVEKN